MRLPDFLIIGAMKAGTTSLFHWLKSHPGCVLPTAKEPHFFSADQLWPHRIQWYMDLFEGISLERVTGEASTGYTNPVLAERTADRIHQIVPKVKLIFLVREPLSRLRSHYRHQVQRGREMRPLREAVQTTDTYENHSLYFRCLAPYLGRFPKKQICIIKSEDLFTLPYPGWREVVQFLDLPYHDPLGIPFNVTHQKSQFTRPMLWLWERGVFSRKYPYPKTIKRLGKSLLLRKDDRYASLMQSSEEPLSADIVRRLYGDVVKLETWLGRELWEKCGDSLLPMVLNDQNSLGPQHGN